jgi:uncharacterized lipoprotein YmbA
MKRRSLITCTILALALVACGCGKLPATHYYVLQLPDVLATTDTPRAGEAGGWEIGVRPFRVDSPFDQDRIVYRVGDDSLEIGFYAYHLWAAPLSRMLPDVVARGLDGVDGVRSIEPVMPGRDYAAYLDGRVLAVEEVDREDDQRVRVLLTLRLTSDDGVDLWSESLEAEGTTRTDEVHVVVERMSEVLADALADARDGLARAAAVPGRSD